ncbi:hypothetical protein RvY_01178-1 [Ramazzottius varieornatus]|uniref:Receptor ligand binding region domain-containing protein n=1 Tax=Ramazzottius varieornatus TaxID=947166 RepID=A0A1D1UMJ6_RAMVA|nr:hypothetical protein RvY_01178-1 [Ramazzottius varieornatus]
MEGVQLSRISREFGLPIIWTTGSAAELENKAVYPNVILASPLVLTTTLFVTTTLSLIQYYGWETVYIVHDTAGPAYAAAVPVARGLQAALSQSGATVYRRGVDPSVLSDYTAVLTDIQKQARSEYLDSFSPPRNHAQSQCLTDFAVVCLAGHASSVRSFMVSAAKMGMTDGEYVR